MIAVESAERAVREAYSLRSWDRLEDTKADRAALEASGLTRPPMVCIPKPLVEKCSCGVGCNKHAKAGAGQAQNRLASKGYQLDETLIHS